MNTPKRIAYIFEEAKIFLTKDGRYYGFSEVDGKVKCWKLSKEEKDIFSSRGLSSFAKTGRRD